MIASFGIPGESLEIRANPDAKAPDAPWLPMSSDRPETHYICQVVDGVGVWVEPPPTYRKFYGNEKLDLFTQAEQLAVVEATMTDPMVKLMYDRLLSAAFLTYEDPETERGLQLLVAKGLLTQERKAQIVSAMTREGA